MMEPEDEAGSQDPERNAQETAKTAEVHDANTTSSNWDTAKFVTLFISLLSLSVSLFSFYFQSVQVRHDLRGTLFHVDLAKVAGIEELKGQFLVTNAGNQYEVVQSLRYLIGPGPYDCSDAFILPSNDSFVPVPLKPGESVVLKVNVPIDELLKSSLKAMTFPEGAPYGHAAYLCGYFSVLGPDGRLSFARYKFGAVSIEEDGSLGSVSGGFNIDDGYIKLPEKVALETPRRSVGRTAASSSSK